MTRRPRLTIRELDTLLSVAGDALAGETLSRPEDEEAEYEKDMQAFESGMEKLRMMLGDRLRRKIAAPNAERKKPSAR